MPRELFGSRLRHQAVPVAEYLEWPFQGFKRTKIRDVTYNLEEHFHLPINPAALDINYDAAPFQDTSSTVKAKEEQGSMDRRRGYKAAPDVERRPFVGIYLCS